MTIAQHSIVEIQAATGSFFADVTYIGELWQEGTGYFQGFQATDNYGITHSFNICRLGKDVLLRNQQVAA